MNEMETSEMHLTLNSGYVASMKMECLNYVVFVYSTRPCDTSFAY